MSLVASDGHGRRIGPKVFADVPSQRELASAKRGRAVMLLITCLLLGALLLSLAAVGFFAVKVLPQVDELKQTVVERDEDIVALQADLAMYREYDPLQTQRNEIEDLRAEIKAVMDEPNNSGAEEYLRRQLATLYRREPERQAAGYLSTNTEGSWSNARAAAVDALAKEAEYLREELAIVKRYVPPRPQTVAPPSTTALPTDALRPPGQ